MANITNFRKGAINHQSKMNVNNTYVASVTIDFAKALEAKGSALAAADTVECLTIPAGTMILYGGLQLMDPADSTTLTVDVGFTGGDVDEFVDGFDAQAGATGDYSVLLATDPVYFVATNAARQIDLLLATLTGTLTSGKVRVFAVLQDVSETAKNPGIALIGS